MIKGLDRLHWLVVTTMLLAALWVMRLLPEGVQVPVHFGATMTPDRWGSPVLGLFAPPVIAACLWLLQRFLPATSVEGRRLVTSSLALALLRVGVTLIFAVIQANTIRLAMASAT